MAAIQPRFERAPRSVARCATTAALAANTYNNVPAVPTITANGNGVIAAQDGITLVAGDSLLVKNEGGVSDGLYVVTSVGTAGTPFILSRHPDWGKNHNMAGWLVAVTEGATQAGESYRASAPAGPTSARTDIVGTHAPAFGKAAGATAGVKSVELPIIQNGNVATTTVWDVNTVGEAFSSLDDLHLVAAVPADLNAAINGSVVARFFTQGAEAGKNVSFNLAVRSLPAGGDVGTTTGTVSIVDQAIPVTAGTDFALTFPLAAATYFTGSPVSLQMRLVRIASSANPANEPALYRASFNYTSV